MLRRESYEKVMLRRIINYIEKYYNVLTPRISKKDTPNYHDEIGMMPI